MTPVLRAWLGFLALGAGLIHLALAVGSPLVIAMPLLAIALAELVWGVFALTAAVVPVPRVARIAAVAPLLFWVLVLLLTAGNALPGIRAVPMLVATLLDLAVAAVLTALLRRNGAAEPKPLRPARYLLAVGAGALVVAVLTIPALVATGVVPGGGGLDLPGVHGGH